jgi:hypothetical protein
VSAVLNAQIAQQVTSTTRVIVSFGARDGGFELTAQLRLEIMDRYGKRKVLRDPAGKFLRIDADEAFCYLDAITLANAEGTTYDRLSVDKDIQGAKRSMAIDLNKMANPYWDTYYPAAVANAAVMVFQVTEPWLWSAYCLEELAWFLVQGLGNLERGKETPCVFMVFPEAVEGFESLLGLLSLALKSENPAQHLAHERFQRMLHGLAMVTAANKDTTPGAFGRIAGLHQRVDRMIQAMRSRIVKVPSGSQAIGFTDYYDDQQRKIVPKNKAEIGAKPPTALYEHQFLYKYSITQEFLRQLFVLLDADLAKVNIYPVPAQ